MLSALTIVSERCWAPALDADVSSTLTRGLEELTSGVNSLLIIGGLGVALYLVFAGLERALRATPARRVVSGVGVVVGGLYLLLSLVYVVSTQSPSLSLLLLAPVAEASHSSKAIARSVMPRGPATRQDHGSRPVAAPGTTLSGSLGSAPGLTRRPRPRAARTEAGASASASGHRSPDRSPIAAPGPPRFPDRAR